MRYSDQWEKGGLLFRKPICEELTFALRCRREEARDVWRSEVQTETLGVMPLLHCDTELGLLKGQNRHHVFRVSQETHLHPMTSLRRHTGGAFLNTLARSLLSSVTAGGLRAGSAEGWF